MVSLRPLVGRRRLDAGVAWLVTAVLVVCAGRFLTLGELDWAAFVAVVVGVALVSPVLERDPAVTPRHDGESTADIVDLPGDGTHHRTAVRAMRALLVLIAALGLVQGNVGLLVNGGVTLLITYVPALLGREYDYPMDPGLTLWVTVAVFLHAVGALGPYENVEFYDTLTHTLSATLLAGIGFAVARAVELHGRSVAFDPTFRGVFVVVFVLAAGVAWEILEFASGGVAAVVGGEAVLAQYGTGDIVHDLAFNTVGALVVATLSTGRFEAVARTLAGEVDVLVRGGE